MLMMRQQPPAQPQPQPEQKEQVIVLKKPTSGSGRALKCLGSPVDHNMKHHDVRPAIRSETVGFEPGPDTKRHREIRGCFEVVHLVGSVAHHLKMVGL